MPEDERSQDEAHDHQRDAGVAGLGGPEDAHAVGDGLGAGQRRAPRRERLQHDEQRRPEEQAVPGLAHGDGPAVVQRMCMEVAEHGLDRPHHDEQHHVGHEEERGQGEGAARLADAAQVAVGDEDDEADGDPHPSGGQVGEDRRHGGDAGGHRHRHRERVVDEQRHGGDLRDRQAEVLTRHHVGAARLRVDLDDLEVRRGDEEQDHDDGRGDRHHQCEGGDPDVLHQLEQDLFGGVGRGRDDVRGQDRQRGGLAQPLHRLPFRGDRRAEDGVLEPVPDVLGQVDRIRRREGLGGDAAPDGCHTPGRRRAGPQVRMGPGETAAPALGTGTSLTPSGKHIPSAVRR